ncbi:MULTISPECIES: hypothetical protein [unclassified Lysobacter]
MVLVVLGLVTVLLVQFLGTASRERHEVASADLLGRADDALLAFAMVNSRLPCPASDGSGEENCGSGQVGQLPYQTLGLPDANARRIRYGVLRRSAALAEHDADLSKRSDRYFPLQVFGGKSAMVGKALPNPTINGLDMCWALRSAQNAPADAAFLHVTQPGAPADIAGNIAYALALPRGGDGFSGHQAGSTAAFDSPRRPSSPEYDDRVLAVGMDQLFSRMRCGDNLAAVGHAHFNAAASIAVMHTALIDYKSQLAVAEKMALANTLSGGAAIAGGISGVMGAGAGMADSISEGLASTGIVAYKVGLAAAAVAAAVAVTITAATMEGFAIAAHESAKDAHDDVDPLISRAAVLNNEVLEHAKAADKAGMY